MKRRRLLLALLLVVLLGAGLMYVRSRPDADSPRRVEGWLTDQLQGIAGGYLVPDIHFDAISYVPPTGVKLTNVRLTAADAAGIQHDIVTAAEASIELGRVPLPGEPIVIRQISLLEPQVTLVAMSADDSRLVGFSNLFKTGDSATPRVGSVFEIRRLSLSDGRVVYDPRVDRTTPFVLDQINGGLLLVESSDGLLTVDLELERQALLQVLLAGTLDLGEMAFRAGDLRVNVGFDRGDRSFLPPQLRVWLDRFGLEGRLVARIQGDVPLTRPVMSRLDISATLTDARAIIAGFQPSVNRMEIGGRTDLGTLWIDQLAASSMGGSIDFAGSTKMNDEAMLTSGRLTVIDLKLDELEPMTGPDDRLGGMVSGRLVLADAPLATLRRPEAALPSTWGSGDVVLDQVRAVRLPVIGNVIERIFGLMKLTHDSADRDRVACVFDLTDEGIVFRSVDYSGRQIAGRGTGTMSLEGRLNLRVNAASLERVEGAARGLGRNLDGAIDRVGGYWIRGTAKSPSVDPIDVGR